MKKKIIPVLSGILALTMLNGCGAPQAQTEPTTVNQAMLIEKSSQEQESYTFPEHFAGDWTTQEGKLTIHADATVVADQGVVLPTATVTPRQFDQADVDNLLKVFLKGEPLYENVATKQELQETLDYINSPEWQSDPDGPTQTPEQLEARRKELNAWYEAEIAKAPEEKPVIHGFSDSHDPKSIIGTATVDGIDLSVNIDRELGRAEIERKGFALGFYTSDENQEYPDEKDAIAQADALMEELGFENMSCDDVQLCSDGILRLYYVPTVNGIRLSSIRVDFSEINGPFSHYQYWNYSSSEENNPDTVSWYMENIQIFVGKDGICSFVWQSPSREVAVKEEQSALLPFEEIASIADTMLPIVVIGPKETSLVDLDRINGFDTKMNVEITKVSLTLMRVRDKGSSLGTIVPVWDFWGTWSWYNADQQPQDYTVQPMLTLNAIDGSVINRQFGY